MSYYFCNSLYVFKIMLQYRKAVPGSSIKFAVEGFGCQLKDDMGQKTVRFGIFMI
jgi:hypothetical protein